MHQDDDPTSLTETVRLQDGRQVLLRPIRPDDAPRLQAGFKRLSTDSIYMRFLQAVTGLSDAQARQFATVDYISRMALVGTIEANGKEWVVAVARYSAIDGDEPGLAEAAIIVGDDFQGVGLGKILMKRLLQYARQHGVRKLVVTVHSRNTRVLRFIAKSGLPYEKKVLEPGIWEIRIWLEPESQSPKSSSA